MENKNRPVWSIDNSHPEYVTPIDEAFRQIIDPEIGLNILELGLIRNVNINEEHAHVDMIMTTPFCPYAPALLEAARSQVEHVVQITTTVEMGIEQWDPSYMEEGAGADWGLF